MIEIFPAFERIDGKKRFYRQERSRATLARMSEEGFSSLQLTKALTAMASDTIEEFTLDDERRYLLGLSWGIEPMEQMFSKSYLSVIQCVASGLNPETGIPKVVDAQFWASNSTYEAFQGGWLAPVDSRGALHYALWDVLESVVPVNDVTLVRVEGEEPFIYGQRIAEEAVDDIDDIPENLKERLLGTVASYYADVAVDL